MKEHKAIDIIGGLSNPSKMPWYSWSTPATACGIGSKLAKQEGTVCSKCYALKGMYMFPRTKDAMARRLAARDDPRFVDAFIEVLNAKYKNTRKTYKGKKENRFRWYDSGDIGTLKHLIDIRKIAEGTPQIRHWLPTKEVAIVARFKEISYTPSNLIIRPSHPMVGQRWKDDRLQSTCGCDDDVSLHQCPAHKQENMCKNCDACWTEQSINYKLH